MRSDRVLGDVAVVGDHEGDELPDVSHLVRGERELCARVGERRVGDEERCGLVERPEIGRRQDEVDAGQLARPRGVDGRDPRVGVGTSQTGRPQDARGIDVVDEASEAPQQARVLVAGNAGADHPCRGDVPAGLSLMRSC